MRHYVTATLLATALALGVAPLTATPSQAATYPKGLPSAVVEDACAFGVSRCVWDARHQGNGRGKSYILSRPAGSRRDYTVRYVTHKRAHTLVARYCKRPDVAC